MMLVVAALVFSLVAAASVYSHIPGTPALMQPSGEHMDDTTRPPLQTSGLFAMVTEFKMQLKEMKLKLDPATAKAHRAPVDTGHTAPADTEHTAPADTEQELQAVLLELQAENTDLKGSEKGQRILKEYFLRVQAVLQAGLSSFENPREQHPLTTEQQDRVSASRQDERVLSKTDESHCTDIPWTNGFGDTCKEIEVSGIQFDWEDLKGVRADVACCKFGGGSKSITA